MALEIDLAVAAKCWSEADKSGSGSLSRPQAERFVQRYSKKTKLSAQSKASEQLKLLLDHFPPDDDEARLTFSEFQSFVRSPRPPQSAPRPPFAATPVPPQGPKPRLLTQREREKLHQEEAAAKTAQAEASLDLLKEIRKNLPEDLFWEVILASHGFSQILTQFIHANSAAAEEPWWSILQLLWKSGAVSLDHRGPFSQTALLRASAAGKSEAVQFLLEQRADVQATDLLGMTPLHLAAQGNLDCVEMLLGAKADPEVRNTGNLNPSEIACQYYYGEDAKEKRQSIRVLLANAAADSTDPESSEASDPSEGREPEQS